MNSGPGRSSLLWLCGERVHSRIMRGFNLEPMCICPFDNVIQGRPFLRRKAGRVLHGRVQGRLERGEAVRTSRLFRGKSVPFNSAVMIDRVIEAEFPGSLRFFGFIQLANRELFLFVAVSNDPACQVRDVPGIRDAERAGDPEKPGQVRSPIVGTDRFQGIKQGCHRLCVPLPCVLRGGNSKLLKVVTPLH